MTGRVVLALALIATPVAASPGAAVPPQFHGAWAREGGRCSDGNAQMEGMLTIRANRIWHGESVRDVTAVRRVSAVQIGVDTRNDVETDEAWTSTTLLTLSHRGQRLAFDPTRRNGRRLSKRAAMFYRRCP